MMRAYAVHLYTAAGIVLAFLATTEIASDAPNLSRIFLYFFLAVVIDATDGILARRYNVKQNAPAIDGGTLDNIVDYINYTFLPLVLIWKMNWLPQPAALFIVPA